MPKRINVLSLFDGISCGRVALERAGIRVKTYYASEIDGYATQISKSNYPDIVHVGDINNWTEWDIDFGSIDLILAGFPCQAWSTAAGGKQNGDTDPRGALVHDLIDIWNDCKKHNPDVKFLFENVQMKKEFLDYINRLFGVDPICINSSLVSAQCRTRCYWTNIAGVTQPDDKGIMVQDIMEAAALAVDFSMYNPRKCKNYYQYDVSGKGYNSQQFRAYFPTGKFGCFPNARAITKRKVAVSDTHYVDLSTVECERLQTLPDNYTLLTEGYSINKSLSAVGNGWTVDVIAHILKGMMQ